MLIQQLFDAESSTYTYLVADQPGGEALLIDPVKTQTRRYLILLDESGLDLKLAVDTHTHADHITALGDLREATGCPTMMGEAAQAPCLSARFSDGQRLPLSHLNITAIATPGHTDDSFSFLLDDDGQLSVFTGDALLIGGTGRTDFQNGNPHQAYHSLFERLLKLPDTTRVFPGHDYRGLTMSTIGEERRNNPRLQVRSAEEYATLMGALNLPSPKMMHLAVPANLRCGRPD